MIDSTLVAKRIQPTKSLARSNGPKFTEKTGSNGAINPASSSAYAIDAAQIINSEVSAIIFFRTNRIIS